MRGKIDAAHRRALKSLAADKGKQLSEKLDAAFWMGYHLATNITTQRAFFVEVAKLGRAGTGR